MSSIEQVVESPQVQVVSYVLDVVPHPVGDERVPWLAVVYQNCLYSRRRADSFLEKEATSYYFIEE